VHCRLGAAACHNTLSARRLPTPAAASAAQGEVDRAAIITRMRKTAITAGQLSLVKTLT